MIGFDVVAVAAAVALLSEPAAPLPRGTPTAQAVAWPDTGTAADPVPTGAPTVTAPVPPAVSAPAPRSVPPSNLELDVAVGLDPSAPGTKAERALVSSLQQQAERSTHPRVQVRRLRAGSPSARQVCRAGRYELVIMVGYVPQRDDPVLLVHDCRLDMPLGLRAQSAATDPRFVGALWDEHEALVRDGVKERRRLKGLNPKARAGIIAGVAIIVVGVAIGVLVASALRDEKVVLKVGP